MKINKPLTYQVAKSDWRIGFLNILGKILYWERNTDVIVLHGPTEEEDSSD